jgi:hypothetical protein
MRAHDWVEGTYSAVVFIDRFEWHGHSQDTASGRIHWHSTWSVSNGEAVRTESVPKRCSGNQLPHPHIGRNDVNHNVCPY